MADAAPASRLSLTLDLNASGRHVGDLTLRWSDNAIPLGYYPIPLISLRGGEGPVLLVIGGTHGDEFEGPAAVMRLAERLDPAALRGQVIFIPALNAPAFAASARVSPLDSANLNRAFPGDRNGGPTAMIADYIERVLMPRCNAVIDLHSGGKMSFFTPCTLATRTADPELYKSNLALAEMFGLPLIWELGANNDDRSVNGAAERAGLPMIATELGGGGGVEPWIAQAAEDGLLRTLGHLGILEGAPKPVDARRVAIADPLHSVTAPAAGLFDRATAAGQDVRAGDLAGHFHFPLEPRRPSEALTFGADGYVLAHTCRGCVQKGETLALVVQEVADT
ncbi:MAG: succinylglutamate desuccinylase/aspartoacylase family protein [Pseudomonadota bacterium]